MGCLGAGGRLAAGGLGRADPAAREFLGFPVVPGLRIVYSVLSGSVLLTGLLAVTVLLASQYCGHSAGADNVSIFLGRLGGNYRIGWPGVASKKKNSRVERKWEFGGSGHILFTGFQGAVAWKNEYALAMANACQQEFSSLVSLGDKYYDNFYK